MTVDKFYADGVCFYKVQTDRGGFILVDEEPWDGMELIPVKDRHLHAEAFHTDDDLMAAWVFRRWSAGLLPDLSVIQRQDGTYAAMVNGEHGVGHGDTAGEAIRNLMR